MAPKGIERFPCFFFRLSEQMEKTAVLIDAGFLRTFLPTTTGFAEVAAIVEAFAVACIDANDGEEMHRVLYYDCAPYEGDGRSKPHPLDPSRAAHF